VEVAVWVQRNFAQGIVPPFSFTYDGSHSSQLLPNWKFSHAEKRLENGCTLHTFTWVDPKTKLEVRCETTLFPDFPAVEWVLKFKFTGNGEEKSPLLEDVRAVDLRFVSDGKKFVLHRSLGSNAQRNDFEPIHEELNPNAEITLTPVGGRSSNTTSLPFFNLEAAGDGGVIVAIGWSGQWKASFARESDGIKISAGMELIRLWLLCLQAGGCESRWEVKSVFGLPFVGCLASQVEVAVWVQRNFAQGIVPPFSFTYDGSHSSQLLPNWKFSHAEKRLENGCTLHTFTWVDPKTKLEVRCETTLFPDFPAVEWVLKFKFTGNGEEKSPLLEDVRAVDLKFVSDSKKFVLHRSLGSNAQRNDFEPLHEELNPNAEITLTPVGVVRQTPHLCLSLTLRQSATGALSSQLVGQVNGRLLSLAKAMASKSPQAWS
jgi:hypothetical protein